MAVLLVWGGFLIAEKVYEIISEQQEQQRRATAAQIQQRRLRDDEEWQLTQPRTLLNEEQTTTWTGPPPPQEYVCPISLELMRDPVIIETGQTFDRYAWGVDFPYTCPLFNTHATSQPPLTPSNPPTHPRPESLSTHGLHEGAAAAPSPTAPYSLSASAATPAWLGR